MIFLQVLAGASGNVLHTSGSVIAPKVIQVVTAPPVSVTASSSVAHQNWASGIGQRKRINEMADSLQSDRQVIYPNFCCSCVENSKLQIYVKWCCSTRCLTCNGI
jgi:hypothetical protein